MSNPASFSFSGNSVAGDYDNILVPALFTPWAQKLITEHEPWTGLQVLDLATGTGVVASLLAHEVGNGQVTGADINPQMLAFAEARAESLGQQIKFIECSAEALDFADESLDVVVCQQGFQFFPDKAKAAAEIFRVLRPKGTALISTWCPVEDCDVFGAICAALEENDEPEVSAMMRVPFDHMPKEELATAFLQAGFLNVEVDQQAQTLFKAGGTQAAIELMYATPISPKLLAMSDQKQAAIQKSLIEKMEIICQEHHLGCMTSLVLKANKP
jgi:ubiquinone/menaquinone biosynthesis C-methylase UbiE